MAEGEKRRATTFVTSRGAIINIAAPSVYIAPGVTPVDVTSPAELREEVGKRWYPSLVEEFWTDGFSKTKWKGVQNKQCYFSDEYAVGFDAVTPPIIVVDGLTALNFTPATGSRNALILTNRNPSTRVIPVISAINSSAPFKYGQLIFSVVLPSAKPVSSVFFGWQLQAYQSGCAIVLTPTKAVLRLAKNYTAVDIDILTGANYDQIFDKFNQFAILWQPNKVEVWHVIPGGIKVYTKIGEALLTDYADYIPQNAMPLFFELVHGSIVEYQVKLGQMGCGEGLIGEYDEAEDYFRDDGGVYPDWNGLVIGAGDSTLLIYAGAFDQKTIHFHTSAAGNLTVEVQEPDGTWRTYDTVAYAAGEYKPYVMSGYAKNIRISFSAIATVTAWYDFRMS